MLRATSSRPAVALIRHADSPRAAQELEWVARIRTGDTDAFEALFMAYYEPLVQFAFTHVDERASAEEVVQEVLLRVWEQRAQWEVRDSVRAYLYGATRNRALNWLRRSQLEQRWTTGAGAAPDDESVAVPHATPADERLQLREIDDAIRRAIARLPERRREVFVLSRQHHLTHEQIASVLGISIKTVQEQIGRALKALRVSLADWID